jgi:hypothetical protein
MNKRDVRILEEFLIKENFIQEEDSLQIDTFRDCNIIDKHGDFIGVVVNSPTEMLEYMEDKYTIEDILEILGVAPIELISKINNAKITDLGIAYKF